MEDFMARDAWYCKKCRTWNKMMVTRCGFCSTPKPENVEAVHEEMQQHEENTLKTNLHNAIERLPHGAHVRIWRYLEDNFL